jgi:hypothetical protein
MLSGSRQQALVDARKLMRAFGASPDTRRRAQAVMSELRHAEGWSAGAQRKIDAVDAWLQTQPPLSDLEERLRILLTRLADG